MSGGYKPIRDQDGTEDEHSLLQLSPPGNDAARDGATGSASAAGGSGASATTAYPSLPTLQSQQQAQPAAQPLQFTYPMQQFPQQPPLRGPPTQQQIPLQAIPANMIQRGQVVQIQGDPGVLAPLPSALPGQQLPPGYVVQPMGAQGQLPQIYYTPPPRPGNCTPPAYCCSSCTAFAVVLFFFVGFTNRLANPLLGVSVILALVPGALLLWACWWRNHRTKASIDSIAKYLIIGALGVIPVFIAEVLVKLALSFTSNFWVMAIMISFIVAGCTEESFKFIVVYLTRVNIYYDYPYTVLLYSLANTIGFALTENVLYTLGSGISVEGTHGVDWFLLVVPIVRGLLSVPLHCITSVLIGADVAESKFQIAAHPFFKIMWKPVLLHGLFDFVAFAMMMLTIQSPYFLFLILINCALVVIGFLLARSRARTCINYQPADYLPAAAV